MRHAIKRHSLSDPEAIRPASVDGVVHLDLDLRERGSVIRDEGDCASVAALRFGMPPPGVGTILFRDVVTVRGI